MTVYLDKDLAPTKNFPSSGVITWPVEGAGSIGENANILLPPPDAIAEYVILTSELERLKKENRELRQITQNTEKRMIEIVAKIVEERLEYMNAGNETVVDVLELRDISDKEAAIEILELFKSSDTVLFYSDISDELSLDIEQVVEVCSQLREKGEIRIGDRD